MEPIHPWLAVSIVGVLVMSGAGAWWLHERNPAAPGGETLWIDYDLFTVDADGTEYLVDTTHHEKAVATNATRPFRVLGPDAYGPLGVERSKLSDPGLTVEFVLAKLDRETLRPGTPLDVRVDDALGADDEVVRGQIPRRSGPFPAQYDVATDEFRASFDRDPVVGDIVNTTSFFRAKVASIDGGTVHMEVALRDNETILSRFMGAIYRVDMEPDRASFSLYLFPMMPAIWKVFDGENSLGLAPGSYLWMAVTDDFASYAGHPRVNPGLVGQDYHLVGRILEKDPRS